MLAQTLDDAALVALIPGVVVMLRRTGMPARLAPLAAVAVGILLVCLADLAGGAAGVSTATVAGWTLTGLIDGLAATGLTRLAATQDGASRRRPTPAEAD